MRLVWALRSDGRCRPARRLAAGLSGAVAIWAAGVGGAVAAGVGGAVAVAAEPAIDTVAGATPASFAVANQEVAVAFPPVSAADRFQIQFSTETVPGSTATKLTFVSVDVYLNNGVAHTAKVKRHGKLVKTIVYEPNATMRKAKGTLNVSLADLTPGSYTCKLRVNYTRKVSFRGRPSIVPFTSTITEALTLSG